MNSYFVYLLASRRNGTLYCGVTNDLVHRTWLHRTGQGSDFTAKYNVTLPVWYEEHGDIRNAIHRETQIKRWHRAWKLKLIEDFNPDWRDLYDGLLPGPARTYEKPPVVDPAKATRQQFAPDDPFVSSFDTSDRSTPPDCHSRRAKREREPRGDKHHPRCP
jgi:putative endonuclease